MSLGWSEAEAQGININKSRSVGAADEMREVCQLARAPALLQSAPPNDVADSWGSASLHPGFNTVAPSVLQAMPSPRSFIQFASNRPADRQYPASSWPLCLMAYSSFDASFGFNCCSLARSLSASFFRFIFTKRTPRYSYASARSGFNWIALS